MKCAKSEVRELALSLLERRENQCCYPVGGRFCKNDKWEGSYCEEHLKIMRLV